MVISSPSSSAVIVGGRSMALAARAKFAKILSLLRVILDIEQVGKKTRIRERYEVC
jgi:hypothetical protein